ncbi:hydroxymethylglutaryl-CoA synthase [Pendulispora brunnea]|uniref:Hydroxymethylglutaryl-CoA synthase n=1 Tax=Pendulispora brunnea TaxID=2905690 RepID=A0ABZ2JYS0_9BACT
MSLSIGIDAIALGVPRGYVQLTDLAEARGVPPEKYRDGLGVEQMAVAAADEDAVALAANAARRALSVSRTKPADIGLCIVGTETAVDHSKPVAAFLHGLAGLPPSCRVFETKHACFGGTAGLLNAIDWIASGSARGRAAMVICTDIARYQLRSAAEPTQGAGAVAMIVRESPRLLAFDVGRNGSYSRDVHDFWRPLHAKEGIVDGHFSVDCYLAALEGAYREWLSLQTAKDEAPVRACYHVPYGKMSRKAHRHRKQIDGLTKEQADASFESEVGSSLILPNKIGNAYTASLYLSLASLLHHEATDIERKRITLFSYGSGCVAEFFSGRVVEGAAAWARELRIDEPLNDRTRLTVEQYERVRGLDTQADPRFPDGQPKPVLNGGRVKFLGVDSGERRVYG